MDNCCVLGCGAEGTDECCGELWCLVHLNNHQEGHEECAYCQDFAPCAEWTACGDDVVTICESHLVSRGSNDFCGQCGALTSLHINGYTHVMVESYQCAFCRESIGEPCQDSHDEDCQDDDDDTEDGLHEYDYTPCPLLFHGDPPRYYGVELEVDDGNAREDTCNTLMEILNAQSLFYLKSDGSLNCGIEVVTHPCTLQYHEKEFPWEAIRRVLSSGRFKSHNTDTCGLHIHVSRKALGFDHTQQDLTLSNLILLYWKHWLSIVRFSRRKQSEIDTWCKLNYHPGVVDALVDGQALEVAKRLDKYAAINTNHPDTIEFRIFKGTLHIPTLIAALQFTDVLLDLALTKSMTWIVNSTWNDIAQACDAHHELMQYLAERDLLCVSS